MGGGQVKGKGKSQKAKAFQRPKTEDRKPMHLHQQQQFDFLLMTSAERFIERIVQRSAGAENALRQLKENPDGEGVWLDEFVAALFDEFLLNNTAGACFILAALEKRTIAVGEIGKIEQILQRMARQAFSELFRAKVIESLEQSIAVGA